MTTIVHAQEWKKYNLATDSGVILSFNYPESFKSEEDNPSRSALFINTAETNVVKTLMLQTINTPPELTSHRFSNQNFNTMATGLAKGLGSTPKNVKMTKIDHLPAVSFDVTWNAKSNGITYYMNNAFMMLLFKSQFIAFACGTSSFSENKKEVDRIQQSNKKNLCRQFFNSVNIVKS